MSAPSAQPAGKPDLAENNPPRARVWALISSSHPVPSLVVASVTALFAWGVGLAWPQVTLVFFAMLANQTSIGLGNDWCDAPLDRVVGRGDKPLATGGLSLPTARNIALALSALALGLSGLLGLWAVICQAVMLAAGWWYNVHAKRHWSSPLSYLLGFGLLPIFPLQALNPPATPPTWVVVVAALLGLSAHFANALPDLAGDRELGIRGLPQILGPRLSGLVLMAGVVAATLTTGLLGDTLPVGVRVTTVVLAIGAAGMATLLAFRSVPPRIIFPLVMASAVLCAAGIATHFALQ